LTRPGELSAQPFLQRLLQPLRAASPSMAAAVGTRPSRRAKRAHCALGDVSNDVIGIGEELLPMTALQEQPAVDAATTAEHAARLSLPRITAENAAQHPPPSLNGFRTAAARAPANSVPALWFCQMTGDEWPRDSHSFDVAKKRHRRMVRRGGSNPHAARSLESELMARLFARAQLDDYKAAERVREFQRDRSARERAQDDGAQAAERKRVKRDQLAAEKDAAAYAAAKREVKVVHACVRPSVREGRFVVLAVQPRRLPWHFLDLEHGIGQQIRRGGRPRLDATVSGVAVGPNGPWLGSSRAPDTCVLSG